MILLTGANGFLGNRLRQSLAGRAFVALVRGQVQAVEDARADLTDPDSLDRPRSDAHPRPIPWAEITDVIHCASAIPARSKDFARTNVEGTRNLFARLDPNHLRSFILLSSVSVYDVPTGAQRVRFREDSQTCREDPYGLSKLAQEHLLRDFARGSGARTVILRPSSIYGPGNTSRTVLPIFVELARANQPIKISGSRHYVQNFVHVADVAQVVLRALDANFEGTCNVFSDETMSIETLARRICAATGSSSEIHAETNEDPYPHMEYPNDRVKAAFGVSFRSLEEGLATLPAQDGAQR